MFLAHTSCCLGIISTKTPFLLVTFYFCWFNSSKSPIFCSILVLHHVKKSHSISSYSIPSPFLPEKKSPSFHHPTVSKRAFSCCFQPANGGWKSEKIRLKSRGATTLDPGNWPVPVYPMWLSHGMVGYGMVWYGRAGYGMVWYVCMYVRTYVRM